MDVNGARTVVVTGANRGLGLEFTRQLLARGDQVVAGCRQPGRAEALATLAASHPGRLRVLALDVADDASRQAFAAEVLAQPAALDLLVNNAGVLASGERFGELEAGPFEQAFRVNAVAPLLLAQALAPSLARGRTPRVLNISSRLGSMALADAFRTPSYSVSKAALNMATVLMARALNPLGVGVLATSPGWVRTDMGGEQAPLAADESVRRMLAMLDARTTPDAGDFVDFDGSALPW